MIQLCAIRKYADRFPQKKAIIAGNKSLSWKSFQQQTEATVAFLLQHFEAAPAQAFYVTPNRLELLPWLAACATLGIPMTGIDYSLDPTIIRQLIDDVGADFVLYSNREFPQEPYARSQGTLFIDIDSDVIKDSVDCPIDRLEGMERDGRTRPFRSISFTSGTTGLPKCVFRTQSFDRRRFEYFTSRYNFTLNDKFLVSMPLYHAAGNGWARLFLSLGATLHLAAVDDPSDLAVALAKHEVTVTVMHPHILRLVLDELTKIGSEGNMVLRWLLVGGKNFPPSLKAQALDQLGEVVYEYYGTTETGVNTIAEPSDLRRAPLSVGLPFDGNSVVIVDQSGKILPEGRIGSVAITSYMNMHAYKNGNTDELFLKGVRYIRTPDHGYLDNEGRLYLVNRAGTGSNLYAIYRLEDRLRDMPGVIDVFLLQQSDKALFDCVLELDSTQAITETMTATAKLLAANEMIELGRFHVVDEILYSPSGKVQTLGLKRKIGIEQVS